MTKNDEIKKVEFYETEKSEKDGRYAFVYTDCYGKQKFLYSWKLEPTDSLPTGCRPCLALREKEKNIQRDLHDGIVPYGGNLTVLDLVQKYIGQKKGVRHNTQANYDFVINIIKKEEFGTRRIDKIKLSDAKAWFIKLQADGRGYSSIHSVRGIVRPAFQMAVEDDLLRKNPFEFQLCTVVVNDSVTRQAITKNRKSYFWSLSEMMTITQNTIMECLFCLRLDFVFLSFVD
mgnify:FL=1